MSYQLLIKILFTVSFASFISGLILTESHVISYKIANSVGQPIGIGGLSL